MSRIVIDRTSFSVELREIGRLNSSITGNLNTESVPSRAFVSVERQFLLLQRICATLERYQSFLDGDVEKFREFGNMYFETQDIVVRGIENSQSV